MCSNKEKNILCRQPAKREPERRGPGYSKLVTSRTEMRKTEANIEARSRDRPGGACASDCFAHVYVCGVHVRGGASLR